MTHQDTGGLSPFWMMSPLAGMMAGWKHAT